MHDLPKIVPSKHLVFKGEKLPKQDLDDVFVEFYRLESIIAGKKEEYQTGYIIIRLVTLIEQFFRNIVQNQLEDRPAKLPKEITLNTLIIDDIIHIVSKETRNVTKEHIVSLSHSFQNTGAINDAMCNYGIGVIFSDKSQQNYLQKEEYDELFRLRHEFVHTIKPPSQPCLEMKQYHELIEKLMKRVLDKIEKRHLFFYYLKGKALRELGDADKARECFEKAIERFDSAIALKSNNAEAHYGNGIMLFELGEYDKAVKCLDSAIALNPNDAEAHYCKGIALSKLGEYDKAVKCLDSAIALKPDDIDVHASKGIALSQLGEYDKAVKCLDSAIALNPNDAEAHYVKGIMLSKLSKYDEAVVCCDRAIALKPDDAGVHFAKGISLYQLGKYDEAVVCCDRAIALKPDDADVHSTKGIALFNLDKYDEAVVCCDRAIALKPNNADAYYGKGLVLRKLGKHNMAQTYLDKAQALNSKKLNM